MTKFDMGTETLPTLIKRTQGAHQALGPLVRQLVDAAQPLEGRFNGTGRASGHGMIRVGGHLSLGWRTADLRVDGHEDRWMAPDM